MGNVVQSDVKGIQLFLNELDKGEERGRQNREEARTIANDKFKKDVTLGQMGLMLDGQGQIIKSSAENNMFLQGKMAIQNQTAINEQNLQKTLNDIKLRQNIKAASNPLTQVLQDVKNKNTAKQNVFNNEQAAVKKFFELNAENAMAKSGAGKEKTKNALKDAFSKSAASTAGSFSGNKGKRASDAEDKKQVQLNTIKGVSEKTGADFSGLVETITENGAIENSAFGNMMSGAVTAEAQGAKLAAEKQQLADDIEALTGSKVNPNTSKSTLEAIIRNTLKPEEKPDGVTTSEFNSFNKDATDATVSLKAIGVINSFLKKVAAGESNFWITHSTDESISGKMRALYPKLFEGVTSVDAGDTKILDTLAGELETLKTNHKSAARSLKERSERHPDLKAKFDSLISNKEIRIK